MRDLSREFSQLWTELYFEYIGLKKPLDKRDKEAEKRSTTTWDCNPLDKPVLRAVGKNYCVCCTNPVSVIYELFNTCGMNSTGLFLRSGQNFC